MGEVIDVKICSVCGGERQFVKAGKKGQYVRMIGQKSGCKHVWIKKEEGKE